MTDPEKGPMQVHAPGPKIEPVQMPLIARKEVLALPPPTVSSADSLGAIEADDGFKYFIKGDVDGSYTRASEWLCSLIAEQANIGAPTPMIIERIDGTSVFGSREIAGVNDQATTQLFLTTQSNNNLGGGPVGLKKIISSIFALDMFLFNDDRHFGNYITTGDQNSRRLYTFDFSRALFWNWPLDGFPINYKGTAEESNTRRFGVQLRKLHGFDQEEAIVVLERIGRMHGGMLEGFLNQMPSDWLPQTVREEFLQWWNDGERQNRLDALMIGIADGSLL